jgi:hypothetical protein
MFCQACRRAATTVGYFFVLLSVDATGVAHEEGKALARLHEVANAPIFSHSDAFFGNGIVGGPLTIVSDVARRAASRDEQRGSEIILGLRNLLNDRKQAKLQALDLNETVPELVKIVTPEVVKREITLRAILAPEALPVRADPYAASDHQSRHERHGRYGG